MKQIITISTTDYLTVTNGKREFREALHNSYSWHYIELPLNTDEIVTTYDEFLEKATWYIWYESKSKRDKQRFGDRFSYFNTAWRSIKFGNTNFVSYKIVTKYYEEKYYTLQQLMDNLPAEEMIEYLKDNGLNICPIAR